ncbi:Uncharacterised protein [Vibrio cholerae]|nr:Uncharacterised protein [Vibrio cholerae]
MVWRYSSRISSSLRFALNTRFNSIFCSKLKRSNAALRNCASFQSLNFLSLAASCAFNFSACAAAFCSAVNFLVAAFTSSFSVFLIARCLLFSVSSNSFVILALYLRVISSNLRIPRTAFRLSIIFS